jgi:hypothetical protein
MPVEISTIFVSAIIGVGLAVLGALLTHGPGIFRSNPIAPAPAPDYVHAPSGSIVANGFNGYLRVLLGILVLVVAAIAIGNSGSQGVAVAILMMFVPALASFMIVRGMLAKRALHGQQNS